MNRTSQLRRKPGANPYTTFASPGTGLSRSGGSQPRPGKGLRGRSKKTAKVYRDQRIPLTVDMLAEAGGQCGIRWDRRCRGQADALHEILPRGRGGSITDRANCVPACNPCNEAVSGNPAEAEARGFLLPSGRPTKAVARG